MPLEQPSSRRNHSGPSPTDTDLWTAYIDASALPNPGRMALGAVITAPDGTRQLLSQVCPDQGCNNEAELRALMAVLQTLLGLQARRLAGWPAGRLAIFTDSSVLVEQLAPSPRPTRPIVRLADLFDQARAMLAEFEHVQLRWIPRHRNTEADALARAALLQP
ncbi:ribonuclease HI family protein [Delftia tsuruhatensis]|uniref:ribonuclease HI family protein n=1 Tax=Delftia tsuruhatensis TaxID=180282 RepID=UPI0020905008|nr:ribonuclease HI family protein [Delftia tsuruhatensis]MCO5336147.1 ribonuclease HI family protein [Delftia tsuruhatensis]MCR4544892.1 ribonuclease HI family protein [Delftia tsuruhatensis]